MAFNGLRREIAQALHMEGDGEPFLFMPTTVEELKQLETLLVRSLKALGGRVEDNRPLPEPTMENNKNIAMVEGLIERALAPSALEGAVIGSDPGDESEYNPGIGHP